MEFQPTYGTQRRPQPLGLGLSGTRHPEGAGPGKSAPGGSPGRWSPDHLLWGSRVERKPLRCTRAHAEIWKIKQPTLYRHKHSKIKDNSCSLRNKQLFAIFKIPVPWKEDIPECCILNHSEGEGLGLGVGNCPGLLVEGKGSWDAGLSVLKPGP